MESPEENALPSASVRILLSGYQDEFPQELQKKCSEYISAHPLDGDDPLEAWYQYVKWAEETFPESGWRENIQKLLQTCLDKFNTSEEYFQDVRFIKLWLKYADIADNPLLIYNQLSMRGIGTHTALFYKSWADELFRNGDLKKADKVFCEGLKRKAQPLNKLQSAYGNFHVAVARRILDETRMQKNSEAKHKVWSECKLTSRGRKFESSCEISGSEAYPVISSVLKPLQNIPSRFAAKGLKGIEKAVNGISTDENGTYMGRVERDTEVVPKVQRSVNCRPVHGNRLENTHSGYKSKAKDGFHCPVAVFEVPNPSQRPMYPKEKVYADNTEYSMEELRAASYIRKGANTQRGNQLHPAIGIGNQICSCESQRSPVASVVDKKLAELPSSTNKPLQPLHGNEENVVPLHATGDGTWPTTTFRCRNVKTEHLQSSGTYQHSLTSATQSAVKNIPPEVLTAVPGLSFKETSSLPGSRNAVSNLQHEKEIALLARESKSISQYITNNFESPRDNPPPSEAKPYLADSEESVSSVSARNITLRSTRVSGKVEKYQVHPFNNINDDDSGTAVHPSILLHKAENINNAAEPKDLKEDIEENNGSPGVSQCIKYKIPFVPSPGMTSEEIEQLKGTENKENENRVQKNLNNCELLYSAEPKLQEHLTQRTSSKAFATGLGVADDMHVDKDLSELQPRQNALLSDTCCSQMFAGILLSSTPARKSIFHLGNGNSKKSFGNPPLYARTNEEENLRNVVGEIQHETDQSPIPLCTVSTKGKELLNRVNDPPHMDKSYAVTDVRNVCTVAEQQRNIQSIELNQMHTYSDVRGDINPFDNVLISQLLHHSGFIERNEGGWLKILRKPMPRIRLPFTLKIGDDIYHVIKEIGKGSYARILCATDNSGERVALKVQKPSWLWEAYIEEQIQHRIKDENMGLCFASPSRVCQYTDGSIITHEYLKYGSILNFITEARKVNRAVNENVTLCFMCQIIEAVRSLHSCKIIHGDLKPDNIMIKSVYPPSIQLIDFGRAIDMTLFPPKTTFTYAVTTKDFQSTEMQAKKPWTYQTDMFGLLSTAHCFLFGEYMKVSHKSGKWVIQKSLPRSCHKQLWSQFFDNLLNIESCDKLPDLNDWEAAMNQEIDMAVLDDQLKVIKNVMDGF